MASAIERLLFPQGNFQQIKATAPDQRTYNIEATKDLVENLPGGVLKDILAPAAAGIMSPFYDAIQAATRMQPDSGVSGFIDAFRAENPLSTAFERMTGASGPLFERISNFNMPNVISEAQASEITPTNNLQQRINIANQFELPINYSASDLQAAAKRAMTQPRLTAQLEPEDFFGDRKFTARLVDPYRVNTTAQAATAIPDRNRGMEISEDFIDRGNPTGDFRVVSEEAGLTGGIPDRNRGMEINENFIDRGNPLFDSRVVSEEIGLLGGGRNPMAQFSEERRTKTPEGSFDEIYDTFRDNLRPPSKLDEGIATLLSLAGLATGSVPLKALGAGANIRSGKAARMLKGAKSFNQKLQQSDFGQSTSLADFLRRRKQKNEAASKKTRDEARKITQRISKQKVSPRDDRRGSMPTRTSKPSTSRRSSSSYTEAARARRR